MIEMSVLFIQTAHKSMTKYEKKTVNSVRFYVGLQNEKISHYWSFSHTIGRVNICTYLLFWGTISYQLRDRLIEIKRLKTMNKVSIKMFDNITNNVFSDDEEEREVALKNLDLYSKENMFANYFNVIANHQVSDDKIETYSFDILMYHNLSSLSRDIFYNVHEEILRQIMSYDDDYEFVEKNIKSDNISFISTCHLFFEKYRKEEKDKMIEFCEIQNAKYFEEQNQYALSLLRSQDEAHEKARASLRAA